MSGARCVPRVDLTSDEEVAPCDLLEELGPRGDRHHCEPGFRLDREPWLCGERGTHLSMVGTGLEPDATATLRCVTIGPHGECAPP